MKKLFMLIAVAVTLLQFHAIAQGSENEQVRAGITGSSATSP
jgi:hypothetical protein